MFNNDRKIGLIEETAHGLQYALGDVRMPALVKRQNGQINGLIDRFV